MNSSIKWYAVGAVVVTILVVAAASMMLTSDTDDTAAEPTTQASEPAQPAPDEAEVLPRPDCTATGVAGVELACLGGETGLAGATDQPAGTQASVVNLWAWWCGPCRDELPIFDEFAAAHPEYDVVGVHADAYPTNGAALLEDLEVSLPSYQDSDNLFAGTLGLPGVVPITVIVVDGEQVAMYPQPFESVAELEQAVAEAVA